MKRKALGKKVAGSEVDCRGIYLSALWKLDSAGARAGAACSQETLTTVLRKTMEAWSKGWQVPGQKR